MRILRRLTPHLVFLAVLASTALVCLWVVYRLRQPVSPMDHKVTRASRLSYYVVTRTGGPRFELSGAERVVKIISHAVLDGSEPYDPRRRVSYRLRVRILDQGRVFWQHDAAIDTRQSKAGRIDDMWLQENSFTSRLDLEMTDDRVLIVHLPAYTPPASMLEITLLGEPEEALVRVYQREVRTAAERAVAVQSLHEAAAEAMVQRSTYAPWALMSEEDRHQRMSHKYLRMAAAGEPGVDFQTRSVFYTGFRLPLEELTAEEGLWLYRHRAVALNVVGPATLRIALHRPSRQALLNILQRRGRLPIPGMAAMLPRTGAPEPGGALHIRSITEASEIDEAGPGGVPPAWSLALPAIGERTSHEIEVPAGLHSLHIHTDSPTPVHAAVAGPDNAQFGAIPYMAHPDGGRRLVPDERRFAVYETGPGRLPVVAGIFVPEDPRARIMRIDARMPVASLDASGPGSGLPSTTLAVDFRNAEDETIRVMHYDVQAPFTPFERIDRMHGDDAGVSESANIRVVVPEGTHAIRVTTSSAAALRFYRYLPSTVLYQPPYRDVALSRNHWRYAPRDRRNWFPATPVNAAALVEEQQRSMLVAQARLEPRQRRGGSRSSHDDAEAVVVRPKGRPERHQILEPVPPALVAETAQTWPPGALARVTAGAPTRFRFTAPWRPRLDYVVPDDQLGEMLAVHVDGQRLARFRLTASRGYWNLPRIEPGEHTIEIRTEARGTELYLDRPPAVLASARLFRRRTVYALDAAPLEIEVRKVAGKRVYVTAVIYAPAAASAGDVQVRAVIGGGVPMRVSGRPLASITVPERVEPLPSPRYPHSAVFAGVANQEAGQPRYLTVPLGEDIVPGSHMIGFAGVGAPRMWARFFVTHHEAEPEDRALQWRFRVSESNADEDEGP